MKKTIALTVFCAAIAAGAASGETLKITADRMAADNITGTVVASGHVRAVSHPVCLLSDLVTKRGDEFTFSDPTTLTSCTNDPCHLHWSITGEMKYRNRQSVVVKDMVLRLWGVPVAWFPYWYYPFDTDYGWRIMPGWSTRWGGYLLTKYVYGLAGGFGDGEYGLAGSTRFDMRTKNGFAVGQGLRWQLGDFGRGKFKVYHAWDNDADRYDHHWNDRRKWHYSNWGSDVPDERYALMLDHMWEATERDIVRLKGAYFSDSHFRADFLRDGIFGSRNRFLGHSGNELAWEHVENPVAAGISVSGPLNDFYGGVARLPEAYFDIEPRPLFGLPVNYEAESTAGFLNRNYAKHGDRRTSVPFKYSPGRWADYQAFRMDSYHRITLPMRLADVVSIVPRAAFRGTYWNDSGFSDTSGYSRAGKTGDDLVRTIAEGGVTFSARGVSGFSETWQHVVEPYADVLAQEAKYHGLTRRARPYVFDSVDSSRDWLDQFAGRSRNLPYSWYGVTPGLRNALRKADERGRMRTLFDFDAYAALQMNRTHWTRGGKYHRLSRKPENPNYGSGDGIAVPGFRARWTPDDDCALMSRVEFDTENKTVAFADVAWRQKLAKSFKYEIGAVSRDHRWWDFSSSPYDAEQQKNEDFNMARFTCLDAAFEHDLCDALAWRPFVRWDCREGELDEIGAWVDYRTDCLGFRFSVSYENDYRRLDNSKSDDDWRFGFFVYLRALGPASGTPF